MPSRSVIGTDANCPFRKSHPAFASGAATDRCTYLGLPWHFRGLRSAQFANPKNAHCAPMATLQGAKLANSLTPNASHSSLGSANKINNLAVSASSRTHCWEGFGEYTTTFTGVRVSSPARNRLTQHHVGSAETYVAIRRGDDAHHNRASPVEGSNVAIEQR
jgi:hypothetical protein